MRENRSMITKKREHSRAGTADADFEPLQSNGALIDDRLGAAIRAVRVLRRLTLDDLAESVGVSGSYLSLIERGKKAAPEHVLLALARTLNIDAAALPQLGKTLHRVVAAFAQNGALEKVAELD